MSCQHIINKELNSLKLNYKLSALIYKFSGYIIFSCNSITSYTESFHLKRKRLTEICELCKGFTESKLKTYVDLNVTLYNFAFLIMFPIRQYFFIFLFVQWRTLFVTTVYYVSVYLPNIFKI